MISKKKLLAGCRLYLILDTSVCDHGRLWEILKTSVKGGVDIVQLRDKHGSAKEMLAFARKAQAFLGDRIPFIVNDRVDIARLSGASGVHVGQDDLNIAEARKILGPKKIVGKSCQTLGHIRLAQQEGADYIGFGSVFKTLTKPERSPMALDLLRRAHAKADVPLFAIGGITRENVSLLGDCGTQRIAVCRDILLARNVSSSVGEFKKFLRTV